MSFTLTLQARSGRWIPPALVLATWVVLVVANPGSALDNAANLFFAVLIVAVWFTSTIGNVDDDPHRDLCAAANGGPARLAVTRHVSALLALLVAAVVVGALAVASGSRDGASAVTVVAGTAGLLGSGVLLGVAIGGFLHRPVVRSTAWVVVIAIVAVIVVALLPPVRDVLRDTDHGEIGGVGILTVVSCLVAAVASWGAAALAARRS
jgi:hypothetical protein